MGLEIKKRFVKEHKKQKQEKMDKLEYINSFWSSKHHQRKKKSITDWEKAFPTPLTEGLSQGLCTEHAGLVRRIQREFFKSLRISHWNITTCPVPTDERLQGKWGQGSEVRALVLWHQTAPLQVKGWWGHRRKGLGDQPTGKTRDLQTVSKGQNLDQNPATMPDPCCWWQLPCSTVQLGIVAETVWPQSLQYHLALSRKKCADPEAGVPSSVPVFA